MENNSPDFAEYRPLHNTSPLPRRLDTRNPERWIFRVSRTPGIIAGIFIFFFLVPAFFHGVWAAVFIALTIFLVMIFKLRELLCTPVFDFEKKCFYRDFRAPKYGDVSTLKGYLPFSKITGLQLLYKICHGSKGATWQAYELNLITDDLERLHITDSKDLDRLRTAGEKLAERLGVPLKIHDHNKLTPKKTPLWAAILILLIFSGLGLTALFFTVLQPLYKNCKAEKWIKTPAVVLKSYVDSQRRRSKSGSYMAYKAIVTYRYNFKGQWFTSKRYSIFSDDHTRGASAKRRIVRAFPPGKEIQCLVDPAAPDEAVISTKLPVSELLGAAVLSLVFVFAGLFGFVTMWKSGR